VHRYFLLIETTYSSQAIRIKFKHLTIHVVHPPDVEKALPEVMYDKEHILIGREVMTKRQPGWNGYVPICAYLTIRRATFKLTRDSQSVGRPLSEFEDFRTRFREKREPYILFIIMY
jgi:hypothetical protein